MSLPAEAEVFCHIKVAALTTDYQAFAYGLTIPRRLGDVPSDVLAADRKKARKIMWAIFQAINRWYKLCPEVDVDLHADPSPIACRIGAQRDIDEWLESEIAQLKEQRAKWVKFCRSVDEPSLANKGAAYFSWEIADLERIKQKSRPS